MNFYFSTFIVGFNEIVAKELLKYLKNIEIILLTDGLVIYKTASSIDEIKKLKFLNNSFILIKKFDNISENSMETMLRDLLKDQSIGNIIRQFFPKQTLKFRIRASIKNQFVAIDKNVLRNLEEKIIRAARNLRIDRSLPDIELLLTIRSEGFGLIGLQFTHRTNYEKVLEKGELYLELTYILCLISEPTKDDIFLDPFAGHGSIPIQRAISFPYAQIIAVDMDKSLVDKLQKKVAKLPKKVVAEKLDALNLSNFKNDSVGKIVKF